ncbi:MAG: hypothetical protein HY537_08270 [Deltaproteobacteria bacterium]|nr:hypothetical protein [Deltaproteobacteria bacterium]
MPVFILFITVIMLSSCSNGPVGGVLSIRLIQPTADHCRYTIAPATLYTVDNIYELRGRIGSVVTFDENLLDSNQSDQSIVLGTGAGLESIVVDFGRSGSTFIPLNYDTLFGASLYFAVEQGFLLFSSLDTVSDVAKLVPNLSDTKIVHEARRTFKGEDSEAVDNAEYKPYFINDNPEDIRNYFFSFPTTPLIEGMPLGVNVGIMVHEFTHLVFHYLARKQRLKDQTGFADYLSLNTERALNEGLADYFGFLVAKDPGFFLCTFPNEPRDLSQAKQFSQEYHNEISQEKVVAPHSGGAVWAAIQYQIGQAIGDHMVNGRSLVRLMGGLMNCATRTEGKLKFDFGKVAKCHLDSLAQLRSDYQATAQAVYSRYLGPYGDSSAK